MTSKLRELGRIAREAGLRARQQYHQAAAERKADQTLVTVVDRQTEELIRAGLATSFGAIPVVGEEHGGAADGMGQAWFIDPIDGTTNFVHGIPCWCVAIGLMVAGQPTLGAVYLPMSDELFLGEPGSGAWHNDQPMAGWHDDEAAWSKTDPVFIPPELMLEPLDFGTAVRVRSLGSSQIHFALVASGGARGGYWAGDYGWDLIAGLALTRAAGCLDVTLEGDTPDLSVLANGRLMPWMLAAGRPRSLEHLLATARARAS